MADPDASATGHVTPVRIDSAEEQYAYLLAHFGGPEEWTVVDQRLGTASDGRDMELVSVRMSSGRLRSVAFVASEDDDLLDGQVLLAAEDATGYLETLMDRAFAFSAANPPHHPGTLARFPVPSPHYHHGVAIPMPVLAVDAGRRGLYAPPRVVVIDVDGGEPVGVGEFPGFDPELWPPERLGDWPPPATLDVGEPQLQGMIARMSACWKRVMVAWFSSEYEPDIDLAGDIEEGCALRSVLDLPTLLPYYDRLNPGFARWLERRGQ